MKVILTARDSAVQISNKTLQIGENDINFLNLLSQEVSQNPKQAKKLRRTLIATYSAFVSFLTLSNQAFAAPTTPTLPKELTDSMIIAIATLAGLAVGIAIITLMLAGLWKMWIGKNSRATQWTEDILKGLGQVLFAPILVAMIVSLFILLFHNIPAFQPIISPITVFFQK